jgi:nitroreductase
MNQMKKLELVAHAIKAPSGHNTQPWSFRLHESAIEVIPNFDHALPAADKENRELYISLGCAVENLCIAAGEKGYFARPEIIMHSNSVHTIMVLLEKSTVQANPLFGAIDERHGIQNRTA